MELEFIQGEEALRNSGTPLNEGEAFVFVDGKQVKQEMIDRFNQAGHYVGERPTGMTGKLIVNLYKISVDLIDEFSEHVPGLRFTDIDDKESHIELALIPSQTREFDGSITEGWYISERLNDPLYTNPSEVYKASMQKSNRDWGKSAIDEDQSN